MAAMSPSSPPSTRPTRASIANLLHPPLDAADRNLLHLSQLATSLAPASTTATHTSPLVARTRSVPPAQMHRRSALAPSAANGAHAAAHTAAPAASGRAPVATDLRVTPNSKRMSRTRSALTPVARRMLAAAAANEQLPSAGRSPPSPVVLRPISANPCLRDGVELASHALTALSRGRASTAAVVRAAGTDRMIIDDGAMHDGSSSSHDPPAVVAAPKGKSRTTPDAKRAQNRESAKRFRMAQKRRWEELQRTVREKEMQIERLKGMLQELTNLQLDKQRVGQKDVSDSSCDTADNGNASVLMDELCRAELDLFVKLMWTPPRDAPTNGVGMNHFLPPIAASLGCLHRVIVARVDGSVLGIRHRNDDRGRAMGAEVGGKIWEHVDSADALHLRCSVVHASKLADMFDGHLNVFSYRRREVVDDSNSGAGGGGGGGGDEDNVPFVRMKGCVYPVKDGGGRINRVLLAEFIEV